MVPRAYWLGFNLVKGIGSVRMQGLLNFSGGLQITWQAPSDALKEAGLTQKVIDKLQKVRREIDLEAEWWMDWPIKQHCLPVGGR